MEFTDALHLTSPKEHSDRVGDAQYLLGPDNVFKQNFHPGPIDKTYGPTTAGATKRAKWFLGYPTGVDEVFGQTLYEYLRGKRKLPAVNRVLRAKRLRAIKKANSAKVKAMNLALADAAKSIHESPYGSNRNFYGEWYGLNGVRWCAEAVTYWYTQAGFKGFQRGRFTTYCGAIVDAARHRQRGLALTSHPEPGDLVVYKTDEHVGIFVRWLTVGQTFQDVGGNTSSHDGSPSNGGEVARNTRYVHGPFPASYFIRVGA
jgi:hypothetical protein